MCHYICSFERTNIRLLFHLIRLFDASCLLFLINFKCNRINGKMGGSERERGCVREWCGRISQPHSLHTVSQIGGGDGYAADCDAGAYFTLTCTYAHVHIPQRKISRTTDETKIELWKSKSNRNSVYPFGRFFGSVVLELLSILSTLVVYTKCEASHTHTYSLHILTLAA